MSLLRYINNCTLFWPFRFINNLRVILLRERPPASKENNTPLGIVISSDGIGCVGGSSLYTLYREQSIDLDLSEGSPGNSQGYIISPLESHELVLSQGIALIYQPEEDNEGMVSSWHPRK